MLRGTGTAAHPSWTRESPFDSAFTRGEFETLTEMRTAATTAPVHAILSQTFFVMRLSIFASRRLGTVRAFPWGNSTVLLQVPFQRGREGSRTGGSDAVYASGGLIVQRALNAVDEYSCGTIYCHLLNFKYTKKLLPVPFGLP
jgi:hypothetical protein